MGRCLDAVGEATRRAILDLLRARPSSVADIAEHLPVTRPAVSQHLKVLKEAGLVFARRDGKQQIYHVDPDGLAALRAELERFWDQAMAAYKEAIEQPTKEDT